MLTACHKEATKVCYQGKEVESGVGPGQLGVNSAGHTIKAGLKDREQQSLPKPPGMTHLKQTCQGLTYNMSEASHKSHRKCVLQAQWFRNDSTEQYNF